MKKRMVVEMKIGIEVREQMKTKERRRWGLDNVEGRWGEGGEGENGDEGGGEDELRER